LAPTQDLFADYDCSQESQTLGLDDLGGYGGGGRNLTASIRSASSDSSGSDRPRSATPPKVKPEKKRALSPPLAVSASPEADPLTTIPEKRPRGRPLGSVNKDKSGDLERTKSNVDSVTLMEEFMAQEAEEAAAAPQSPAGHAKSA
jgi:hypothetical protein